MNSACTYCGCPVSQHEPVYVEEAHNGGREPAGQFCNYACLARHIEETGLETGATCSVEFA